jgi:hypothetical protein
MAQEGNVNRTGAMNWYYVDAGQQAGPVEEAQLQELVRNGKVQPDTLVWHEGMAAWAPYREAVSAAAPPSAAPSVTGVPPGAAPAGGVLCSECGRAFSPNDVIRYGDKWICAACKPTFFQRLREGAARPSAGAGPTATEAELLARDYEVDIGGCLSQAWELFKTNAGIMIGATVLVYLALMAANAIPYLSYVLGLLFNGPLIGGLWLFYIKKVRGQEAAVGDAFGGFGPRFWQLVLTQLIPGLITGVFIMLIAILAIPAIVMGVRHSSGSTAVIWVTACILGPLAIGVLTYLSVCWMFALPLAADKGLKFWPALELSREVVSKHWWMTLFLLVVAGMIGFLGFIACCFGLLVTVPVTFAMLSCHYQRVFGDLIPNQE